MGNGRAWVRTAAGTGGLGLVLSGLGVAAASAASTNVAVWLMTETSGTTMTDSSGNGNNGVTSHVRMTGANGYVFDPSSRSKVVVASSPSLNPGTSTFSYTVTMQSSHVPAAGTDYDVLRKGIASTTGGEYKLEIVRANSQGRAFCLVKDARGVGVSVRGTTNVTDGRAHTITCTKTATGLTLKVDALTPRTAKVSSGLGSISNTKALVVGAKSPTVTGSAGDWYNGTLLQARISVG
jgi:hypothetical protein